MNFHPKAPRVPSFEDRPGAHLRDGRGLLGHVCTHGGLSTTPAAAHPSKYGQDSCLMSHAKGHRVLVRQLAVGHRDRQSRSQLAKKN